MPKIKSHRGLKKKIKITKTGKVLRHKAGKSHLLTGKSRNRKRGLKKSTILTGKMAKKFRNSV